MKKALAIRALMMAINLRKPPPGLICHSDRGSQYASHDYQTLLKREWTGDRLYQTRQDGIADVREYVAVYYNAKRFHSTLGYTTLVNYEKRLNTVSGIC